MIRNLKGRDVEKRRQLTGKSLGIEIEGKENHQITSKFRAIQSHWFLFRLPRTQLIAKNFDVVNRMQSTSVSVGKKSFSWKFQSTTDHKKASILLDLVEFGL